MVELLLGAARCCTPRVRKCLLLGSTCCRGSHSGWAGADEDQLALRHAVAPPGSRLLRRLVNRWAGFLRQVLCGG